MAKCHKIAREYRNMMIFTLEAGNLPNVLDSDLQEKTFFKVLSFQFGSF